MSPIRPGAGILRSMLRFVLFCFLPGLSLQANAQETRRTGPPQPPQPPRPQAVVFPGATWAVRTPAEVGLDEAQLDAFAAAVGGDGCIVKDGYLVKTWGNPSAKYDWASAMKPIFSTMLFFAVEEGKLASVDAPVRPFVQRVYGRDLIEKDRTMTFRHLADMTSGYALSEAPGSAWAYNDTAVSLYAKLLFDGVFGQAPDAAATEAGRLGALQFEDGSLFGTREGYGVNASARDFARLGWFWLNKGHWNGAQLLPASYFDAYVAPDVPGSLPRTSGDGSDYLEAHFTGGPRDQTPYGPGIYGFNWWFNAPVGAGSAVHWPDAPADTYQANGYWGERVVAIIPSLNLVVASRGNWGSFEPGNPEAGHNVHLKMLVDAVLPIEPLDVTAGWNLVGLPHQVVDPHFQEVFEDQATSQPYGFEPGEGYSADPMLDPGEGYWILFDDDRTIEAPGTPHSRITVDVTQGWNLVAGPGCTLPLDAIETSPPGLVASPFYGFGASGYFDESDALKPWRGYWVLSQADGTLTMTCP